MNDPDFYPRAVRRGWWLALAVAAVATGLAWWLAANQRPVYKASASMVVTPSTDVESSGDLLDAIETLERRTVVATFSKIPSAVETRESAARRMGVEAHDIRYYWIGSSVLPNTNVIRIDVIGPEAETAAEVANAVADATRREARSLYKVFTMRRLARAEPPRSPERPDPRRAAGVGGLVGLFLGALAALGLEAVRSRATAG